MDVSIDLTLDEIETIAEVLGADLPVGVASDELDFPDEIRERLRTTAIRGLEGRRVLLPTDAGHSVNEAVEALFGLAAAPGLVITVEVETSAGVAFSTLLCDEDLGVEIVPIGGSSVYRFTPFITRDVIRRVIRAADLRPADVLSPESIEMTSEQLEQAATIAETDVVAAADLLRGIGASEAFSQAFATALSSRRAVVTLTALHQPEAELIEGGTLSWIDAGIDGNWLSEPTDDDAADAVSTEVPDRFEVRSVAADELIGTLMTYLPSAFSDAGAEAAEG